MKPFSKVRKRKFRKFRFRKRKIGRLFRRGKMNEQIFRTIVRVLDIIYQSSGAQASQTINHYLEYPGRGVYNGTSGAPQQISTNYTRCNSLYDQYRVRRAVSHYYPTMSIHSAVDQTTPNLLYTISGAINANWPYMYCAQDYDDAAGITSENNALQKTRPHLLHQYKRTVMTQRPGRLAVWLNTALINQDQAIPVATTTIAGDIPYRSSIKYYFPQIANAVYVGYIVTEYDIEYRSLKTQ